MDQGLLDDESEKVMALHLSSFLFSRCARLAWFLNVKLAKLGAFILIAASLLAASLLNGCIVRGSSTRDMEKALRKDCKDITKALITFHKENEMRNSYPLSLDVEIPKIFEKLKYSSIYVDGSGNTFFARNLSTFSREGLVYSSNTDHISDDGVEYNVVLKKRICENWWSYQAN